MKKLLMLIPAALLAAALTACNTATTPSATPPADHTVSKNGVLHKTGLTDPLTNCVSCHGADLKGGTSGVSCYSCHGPKW